MILTVSPNPAWDISYRVEQLRPGNVHQVREVRQRPGGPGVAVASVLACMGQRSGVLLPLGGPLAEAFVDALTEIGLQAEVIDSPVPTRRAVTISDNGEATTLNEPGAPQPKHVWSNLLDAVRDNIAGASVLTVSGSPPPQAPPNLLADLVEAGHEAGMSVILDCCGEQLWRALGSEPELVRLNNAGAVATTGLRDQRDAAQALIDNGAQAVAVSAGREGVLLSARGEIGSPRQPRALAHQINLRAWLLWPLSGNAMGAGGALTAALAHGLGEAGAPELSAGPFGLAQPGLDRLGLDQLGSGSSQRLGVEPAAVLPAARLGTRPRGRAHRRVSAVGSAAGHTARPRRVSVVPHQAAAASLDAHPFLADSAATRDLDQDARVTDQGRQVHRWARLLRAGVAWSAAAVLQPTPGLVNPAHAQALCGDVMIEVLA